MNQAGPFVKWFTPGIGVKRWLITLFIGVVMEAVALAFLAMMFLLPSQLLWPPGSTLFLSVLLAIAGGLIIVTSLIGFARSILAPYRTHRPDPVIDLMYSHSRRSRGQKVVAIGGGTGLPSVLKSLKHFTGNITAIVTVADDGGSSGRLRRDLGVLPPGDLRNNIAALADDESLMTRLFQYRFDKGELGGHAFGNFFISALSGVTGSLETALCEIERVLNIQGSVLPATLSDVRLVANIRLGQSAKVVTVYGESNITAANGIIEKVWLTPSTTVAFPGAMNALREADLILIGPGSLYTSIIPNLLIDGIAEALRQTSATKVYLCNIATQPGETQNYTVADHILALERVVGRGVIQFVLANNAYPEANVGSTHYVRPVPPNHEVLQRYGIQYEDLVDTERPWRHDPNKLVKAILLLSEHARANRDLFRVLPASFAQHVSFNAG